jgi:hypothetical protein
MYNVAKILSSMFWCSESGDHPDEDLAKLDSKENMKVNQFQPPPTFLATYWNVLWKITELLIMIFFKIWTN